MPLDGQRGGHQSQYYQELIIWEIINSWYYQYQPPILVPIEFGTVTADETYKEVITKRLVTTQNISILPEGIIGKTKGIMDNDYIG